MGNLRRHGWTVAGVAALAAAFTLGSLRPAAAVLPVRLGDRTVYDVVIAGGRVMDPESGLDREPMHVGILGKKIWSVSERPLRGRRVLDARGLVVAPGFIDIMSYDPNPVGSWLKLADGVTSNLALHGGSAYPRLWYDRFARARQPLHFGASFFYGQARYALGIGPYEGAAPEQIDRLYAWARSALEAGALGISFSLEYMPGIGREELLPQMRLAARYDAPVFFHARYSDVNAPGTNFDALREILDLARTTGARVHVDHINSTGGTFSMERSLDMLQRARRRGVRVTADTYAYDYWGTYLDSARFDPGWQERFRISYDDLQIAGTDQRLTVQSFTYHRRRGTLAVAYAIPPRDVRLALQAPFVMVASDGIIEPGLNNHPRGAGNFSRVLGRYVRERGALTLMEALEKMSLLPARLLQPQVPAMRDKGRLRAGADADIVVFDPATVADRATVEHPDGASRGIRYVLVAGQVVRDEQGLRRTVRPGRPIRAAYTLSYRRAAAARDCPGDPHRGPGAVWRASRPGRMATRAPCPR